MKDNWWMLVKTVVKSQLDNYVLPGTLTGTEILLLYMAQWKRNLSIATCATFYLLFSQGEPAPLENILDHTQESDNPTPEERTS